jgi:maltooligosyltrehalose trehalohydrolase
VTTPHDVDHDPARVWAPLPTRVVAQIDGVRHPMTREGGGWWTGPDLPPGARYGFLLDDDPDPRPDPRSRRLPDGVHGLTEATPHRVFDGADWRGRELRDGVIYELHVGTFTPEGTLDAAIERLGHLVELGITFVELLPVNAFNGTWNWGYDGVAWYAVHEAYGGPDAYARFVEAAHARGLGVIQDVVYNHLGPSGNYLPLYGPYLREGRANTWGASVNLDEPEVRRYILDNATMWFTEYGVDGLRLDAVHALHDDRAAADPEAEHILAELSRETAELADRLGRPLSLIAESDLNDPVMFRPREAGGYGLTAQWSDDYHHAVHVALTGETDGYYADFAPLSSLATVTTRGFFHAGTFSSFRDRIHGVELDADTDAARLVTFVQDHDQIGNRAAGDRLPATLRNRGLSSRRLGIAAVLAVLTPSTPMLFMGEEWGASTPWQFFTSNPEPDLGRATAEGRIQEFARMGWDPDVVPDPQDPETFVRSKLDWSERHRPAHRALLEQYRDLIALRAREPDLRSGRVGDVRAEADETTRRVTIERGAVRIRINLGDTPWTLGEREELLFTTSPDVPGPPGTVPPDAATVTRLIAHPAE